jgi:hypothetical protein
MSAPKSGEMVLHLPTFLDFLAEKLGLDMHHVYFLGAELKYFVPHGENSARLPGLCRGRGGGHV